MSATTGREVRRLPTTPGVTAFVWDDGDVVEVPLPAGADPADVVWQTWP